MQDLVNSNTFKELIAFQKKHCYSKVDVEEKEFPLIFLIVDKENLVILILFF